MLWVATALDVERDIHGGTAGVADEWFYDRVRAYLAIHDAPTEARRAIAFRHALARWDFGTLSHLADTLAPAALTDTSWVDVDELREAGTIAKLKLGDVAGARALWRTLAVRAERSPADLRSLLIDAYLIDAARRE
jgi:hypothetical protein